MSKKLVALIIVFLIIVIAVISVLEQKRYSSEIHSTKNLPFFDLPQVDPEETANWNLYTYQDIEFTIKYPNDWKIIQELNGKTLGKYPWIANEDFTCMFQITETPMLESNEYIRIIKKRAIIDNKEVLVVEHWYISQGKAVRPDSIFVDLGLAYRHHVKHDFFNFKHKTLEMPQDCMNIFYLIMSTANFK